MEKDGMICIVNVGKPSLYSLKIKNLEDSFTNLEILEWVVSYVKTVRDLAQKYIVEDTTYVFVEVSIKDACFYWKGDTQSLRNTIFHLLFSSDMFMDSAVDVVDDDTPVDIIEKMLQFQRAQPSALDLLAKVAETSANSIWGST